MNGSGTNERSFSALSWCPICAICLINVLEMCAYFSPAIRNTVSISGASTRLARHIGIAMPYVLYQAWAFVAPGLYRHEKKLAIPLLISSILLFYLGAAFAYYVVFPVMLSFFVATTPSGVQMMTDMGSYLDFVMVLLLAFGVAFEVPVATVLLVWTGFVKLATLRKNRGFVLLGIFIFAAFVTPPDAVSQSAMAVPMYLLYEIGIIMAGLLLKDKIAARAKRDAEEAGRGAGV